MALSDVIARLLLPRSHCLGCGEPRKINEGDILCAQCDAALRQEKLIYHVCPQCLSPRFGNAPCPYCLEGGMQGLYKAYAPYHYHGVVQQLVVQLKFGMVEDAAQPLASAMAECVQHSSFDALVPVPLSKNRLRERGFNQAALLADMVAERNGFTVLNALRRVRNTHRQSAILSALRRERNVAHAFEAVVPVQGHRLLLVDDVRTTGATARACADALLNAGAKEVSLLTAAIAPPRK